MTQAAIWRRTDGTLVLDWPDDARTITISRELLEQFVLDLNERAALRSALDAFLLMNVLVFDEPEEMRRAWDDACDRARGLLAVTSA